MFRVEDVDGGIMIYGSTAAWTDLGFLLMICLAESGLTFMMLPEQTCGLRFRVWAAD